MEEDIKRCEELIKEEHANWVGISNQKAIENLIKGYRELEEKLDNSRKANELLNKTNNELRLEIRTTYSKVVNDIISKFNLGDDYIPKSKVKKQIEVLESFKGLKIYEENNFEGVINLLKELMEE